MPARPDLILSVVLRIVALVITLNLLRAEDEVWQKTRALPDG